MNYQISIYNTYTKVCFSKQKARDFADFLFPKIGDIPFEQKNIFLHINLKRKYAKKKS